jgi:hypothetical protein
VTESFINMLLISICMTAEIPQIQPIEKVSALYKGYRNAIAITGSKDSSRIVLASELGGLDGLLNNSDAYLTLASNLGSMRHDLRDFQGSMEESLEYAIKYIRGQFNGRSEAEIQSVGAILGLIPYGSSGQSQGKVSGDVNLGVYDFEKLTNTVPSNHQWLKDFLTQYVTEINKALESVEDGEPDGRLKVEIDRMNNAMSDCYQEENVTRLKFASKNLLGGLKHVREMMFPLHYSYPKTDNFAKEAGNYVDSLIKLKEFAEGKEKVEFEFCDYPPQVRSFKDKNPRSQRPKEKGFLARLFS